MQIYYWDTKVSGFSFAYNLHTDFCFLVNYPDSADLQSGQLIIINYCFLLLYFVFLLSLLKARISNPRCPLYNIRAIGYDRQFYSRLPYYLILSIIYCLIAKQKSHQWWLIYIIRQLYYLLYSNFIDSLYQSSKYNRFS